MTEIIQILKFIPDVVWSGISAAVIALSGVLISNWSNTTRLKVQLRHDSEEKTRERIATMRREVYLKTVEELTKTNLHLASLPQKDPTKENLAEGILGFLTSAAKLGLVAEPKTAILMNQLVSVYQELVMNLVARSMPMYRLKSTITIHENMYQEAQAQVTRVLGEMAKFNEAAQINDIVFGALQTSFQNYQEQADQHSANLNATWCEFNRLNCDFCRSLIEEMRKIGEQQIPVLVEIRRDLGLTTDLNAFRLQMENQWQRMSVQLDDFLQILQTNSLNEVASNSGQ